jgi:hypothetical protein
MSTFLILKPEDKYALTIHADAVALKNKAIAGLDAITVIETPEQLQAAALALSTAAGVVKTMEMTRAEVKAPILDAGKRIDAMAKEFSQPVEAKIQTVRKMVSDHHTKEAARVKAERDAEIARQEAAEKARLAEEARIEKERQAREKAEAERIEVERKAAEAQAQTPTSEESADPLAALRQISEDGERQAEEVRQQEVETARLNQLEADRLSEKSRLAAVPVAPAKVAGIAPRSVWKFEVTDLNALYAAKPQFCELDWKQGMINNAIRDGLRECPGLRIYSEIETHVRSR